MRILEKSKRNYETKIINHSERILNYEKKVNRFNIEKELNDYNKEIFNNINSILILNTNENIIPKKNNIKYEKKDKKSKTKKTNISINIDINNESLTKNSKKIKKEYLTSKHLNSTNFTSIYSNESIINKHHSPS